MTADRSFGRYRVTATLGAGAMGEVFAAIDDVLGREVAVKTLRGNASGLAARLLDDRFRQEARAIAALHHPGVVQVFDLDLAASPPYLVMERMAGPSLKERLVHGPLPAGELRALGIQISRALAAAHAAGIVHRDVKPANILGAGPGRWKLADFGVAHVPDSSITMTGQFVGSPAYAPPEALIRGVSGAPGDVYGLAATLYEAAAGRWPRIEAAAGGTMSALLAPLPPLHGLAPGLPAEVAAAIDRAVAIEPDQRPSADELADALAGAASLPGGPPVAAVAAGAAALAGGAGAPVATATATAVVAQATGGVRWKPWAIGAAIALALALGLIVTRQGTSAAVGSAPGAPAAAASGVPDGADGAAGELAAIPRSPPPGIEGKQAKDRRKIIDEIDKRHYDGARHKLDEYEHKFGESADTNALRAGLASLGPDPHGPDPRDRDDDEHDAEPGPGAPRGPDDPRGPHGHGRKHHGD